MASTALQHATSTEHNIQFIYETQVVICVMRPSKNVVFS